MQACDASGGGACRTRHVMSVAGGGVCRTRHTCDVSGGGACACRTKHLTPASEGGARPKWKFQYFSIDLELLHVRSQDT